MPDGTIFEGYFRHGLPNGRGRIIYSDREIYEGDFIDNKAHG